MTARRVRELSKLEVLALRTLASQLQAAERELMAGLKEAAGDQFQPGVRYAVEDGWLVAEGSPLDGVSS